MRGRARMFWLILPLIALAMATVGAQTPVVVDIAPVAVLEPGAQEVTATVSVTCPARAPTDGIQENRLEVRQQQRGTLVIGVGGTGDLVCDGKAHSYQITALVEEPTHHFRPGPAVANMFVLICDESGATCLQGEVTENILLAGAR